MLSFYKGGSVEGSLEGLSPGSGSNAFSVAGVKLWFGPASPKNPPRTVGWIGHFQ